MAVTGNTDGADVAVALSFPETDMIHHFRITALLTVAALTSLVIAGCGSTGTSTPAASAPATGTSTPGAAGSSGSAPATTRAPATPAATQAPATPGPPAYTTGLPAGYLPLFPFASLADVCAWQASYQSGGHQPWRRSLDITATAFAAFLGYPDVTEAAGAGAVPGAMATAGGPGPPHAAAIRPVTWIGLASIPAAPETGVA